MLHLRALLWAILLAALLLAPGDVSLDKRLGLSFSPEEYFLDLLTHSVLLFVMTWFLARSLASLPQVGRPVVVAAVASALYGLVLELMQTFVPGREATLGDALANTLGVIVCVGWLSLERRSKSGSAEGDTH